MTRAAAAIALLALVATPVAGQSEHTDEGDPLFETTREEFYALLALSGVALGLITWGTVWLFRDANRRAENAALWTIIAAVLVPTTFGLGWIVLFVVWLAVRPAEVLCDARGEPLPGMEARLAEKRGLAHPAVTWTAPPAPVFAPSGVGVAPGRARTACPTCAEVFEYVKNPASLSDVKCPRCGTEGTA